MSSIQNSLLVNFSEMSEKDIVDVLAIEQESYGYPWSEKIFYDCVNNNYLLEEIKNNQGGDEQFFSIKKDH